MSKLNLKDVTLVCVDDDNTQVASKVLNGISRFIEFADIKLFSSKSDSPYIKDKIEPIKSLQKYNQFVATEVHEYINTDFAMFVQTDGYPINFSAWTDEFLQYDYIGAPWNWLPSEFRLEGCATGSCVGNGGFSLRSKKIMEEAANLDYETHNKERLLESDNPDAVAPKLVSDTSETISNRIKSTGLEEDVFICRVVNEELKERGIKYAPCELASYFSVENGMYKSQFGFHGADTLALNKNLGIFEFKEHAYESIH